MRVVRAWAQRHVQLFVKGVSQSSSMTTTTYLRPPSGPLGPKIVRRVRLGRLLGTRIVLFSSKKEWPLV